MYTKAKARSYALALFSIAREDSKMNLFLEQILTIKQAISANKEIIKILNSYSLENQEKELMIKKIFNKSDLTIINFLSLIAQKRLFAHIETILNKFIKLVHNELNIKTGIIYSTKKISPIKIKQIEEKLAQKYNRQIFLKNYIDNELILGLKIVIDNDTIEYSIKSQLRDLSRQLKGGK